jgi:alkaline phosphatase/alkaline phosphatase D
MNYATFMNGKSNGGGPITATEDDRRLGYPSFAAMAALQPDFFIGAGDLVYYDQPADSAAKTLPEMRRKWYEQFVFPRIVGFLGATPAFWLKDDHDFRFNDSDLTGARGPDAELGIRTFREQMPVAAQGDLKSPTYRTRRINRHLQLWFTEGRDYRTPNKSPDDEAKSLWGAAQREWLQRTLLASDAKWKIIVTPTPMVGPDDAQKRDNHTNLNGFRHEADEFFAWLGKNQIENVLTICGDRHWQYHSVHPSGVEEFSCGALNDENSRRGVKPGTAKSTDSDGRIRQLYLQAEPSGGFLQITVSDRANLRVEFRDDTGKVLHVVEK